MNNSPIIRQDYVEILQNWQGKPVIKVITGLRRSGKSTLLALFINHLKNNGISENRIIHINLEHLENEHLLHYRTLHDEILRRCQSDEKHFVLIDEIQNVLDFQKAVDSLYVRDNIDLYITGSNAFLLKGNLATLLSGRFVEIPVLPLSFAEFYSVYHKKNKSDERIFSDYLYQGSMPALIHFHNDDNNIRDYLMGVVNTVLLKDIMARLNLSSATMLETITAYLFDNIGNLTNATKIANTLTTIGNKTNTKTVSNYIQGLTDAYIFYPVQRYDIRGKKILKQQRKYYATDLGMRRIFLTSNGIRDDGRLLENIIYLELLRRYKKVYIGQTQYGEIDFIVDNVDELQYFQVALSVKDPQTFAREISSFQGISDNYPKYLITMDDSREISHNGIKQIYAIDWLLNRHISK